MIPLTSSFILLKRKHCFAGFFPPLKVLEPGSIQEEVHSRSSSSGLDFATLEQLITEIAPFIKLLSFLKSSINPVLSEMAQLLQSWLHHNKAEFIWSLSSFLSSFQLQIWIKSLRAGSTLAEQS